jgi:uncharacterized membrane protein YoaK (UPF0700 family)
MATATSLNVSHDPASPMADIPLPKWNDFASILTYLTSVVGVVVGVVAAIHPGFKEPASTQAVLAAVALLVATGAQIYNATSHRSAHNAAAVAAINQGAKVVQASTPAPPVHAGQAA